MLRIILWSKQEQLPQGGKELAKRISQEANILPLTGSEESILSEIAKLQKREALTDTKTLFLNIDSLSDTATVLQIVRLAEAYSGDYATLAFTSGESFYSSPEVTTDNLFSAITENQTWTTKAVVVRDEFIQQVTEDSSIPSALLKMAFRALGEHGQVDWNLETISLASTSITSSSENEVETTFSKSECSNLFRFAVAVINIEDLFPQYSWENHPAESAAACYHSLAAKFISLGEYSSAQECLQRSDQLEDSPRSLALKGIIALETGEILSGVANMVSSLQEYEKRKTTDGDHYLSFSPDNLELINANLESGLSALNQQQNARAAGFFTDAVFEFDGFYRDCGLALPNLSPQE